MTGKQARKRRLALKLSQEAVAFGVGISSTMVRFVECGRRNASPDVFARWEAFLKERERTTGKAPKGKES